MLMNKKAALFWYTILAGLILVIGIALFISPEATVNYIGEKPLKIIHASLQFEKILHYIDKSAELSAYTSIYNLSNKGGFVENEKCGKFLNYNLWNNEDRNLEDCFPDYENNFKSIFNNHLMHYLDNYPNYLILVNYDYILSKNEKLKIIGIADQDTDITVKALVKEPPDLTSLIYKAPKDEQQAMQMIKDKYSSEIIYAINNLPAGAPKPSEALVAAIIMTESGANEKAISPTGCRGLGQACYLTAQDYIDIFEFLTPCDCSGETCKTEPKCNDRNDARGDPHKSIMFIVTHTSNLMKIFSSYTYQEEFAALSYNAGQTVIKNAIKKTGKKDPTWVEIYSELTPDLITYFKKLEEKENKITEIKNYLPKVLSYKDIYENTKASKMTGAAIVYPKIGAPTSAFVGSYSLKPNFKTTLDFDLNIFDKIKSQAKNIIENCSKDINDTLVICIGNKIKDFNPEWTFIEGDKTQRKFKFEVNTNKILFPFEDEVIIKFALYFPQST